MRNILVITREGRNYSDEGCKYLVDTINRNEGVEENENRSICYNRQWNKFLFD